MNNTSKSSILPLEPRGKNDHQNIKEISSELRKKQEALHAEIEKHADELKSIQALLTEQLNKVSESNKDEFKKIHEIFVKLGNELDKFKIHIRESIAEKFTNEMGRIDDIFQRQSERIEQMEDLLISVESNSSEKKYEQVRTELIGGLKMLGERVGEAIKNMDDRFEKLRQDMQHAVPEQVSPENQQDTLPAEQRAENESIPFGDVKESSLLQIGEEFEIIPKNSIQDLGAMFRKHAENMKFFLNEHEEKLLGVDHLLKAYEEECSAEIAELKRKSKRNFIFSLAGIILVAIISFILHFVFS